MIVYNSWDIIGYNRGRSDKTILHALRMGARDRYHSCDIVVEPRIRVLLWEESVAIPRNSQGLQELEAMQFCASFKNLCTGARNFCGLRIA